MDLKKKGNDMLKKMDVVDVKLACLGKIALFLMIAKLWPPLLSLDWYWYLAIAVVALVKPYYKAFGK
ncbi:MAG TPA: hypothetical protein ENN60_00700 [archaeon]|nr:hypothetical protein [archaeon]